MKKVFLITLVGLLLIGLNACDGFKKRDTQKEAQKKELPTQNSTKSTATKGTQAP